MDSASSAGSSSAGVKYRPGIGGTVLSAGFLDMGIDGEVVSSEALVKRDVAENRDE